MAGEMRFAEVRKMPEAKGYYLARIRGSHHLFEKPGGGLAPLPVHHGKVKYVYVRKIENLD